jgi:hypothetical protein
MNENRRRHDQRRWDELESDVTKTQITNYIPISTFNVNNTIGMDYFVSNQFGESPTKRKVKNHFVKFINGI